MYAGSECVEIWLGVLLVRLGRRVLFAPFPVAPAPAAAGLFPRADPASWSAVSSRAPAVPVTAPAACAAPVPQLRSEPRRKRRPKHAMRVPTTKSAAITTSGICTHTRPHSPGSETRQDDEYMRVYAPIWSAGCS